MRYAIPHPLHVFSCNMGMFLREGRVMLHDFGCSLTQNNPIHDDSLLGAPVRYKVFLVQALHVMEHIGTSILHVEDIV